MSFITFPNPVPVFPTLAPETWSVHKVPSFTSTSTRAITGRESQCVRAVFPRWEFTLKYGDDSWLRDQTQNIVPNPKLAGDTELEQISGLFLACLGSYGEFYYNDPDDNSRLAATLGKGDGSTTTFLVYYPWGNGPYAAPFMAPVGGLISVDKIYFNGSPISAALYSIDSTNTKIVFVSAPANGTVITIDFHFYFRCRWSDDMQQYSQWALNLWEYKQCKFKSVKP